MSDNHRSSKTIHCYACFLRPSSENRNFYFAACGHVSCSSCLKQANGQLSEQTTSVKCPSCKAKTHVVRLDANTPRSVKSYFDSLSSGLSEQQKACELQQSMRNHLIDRLEQMIDELKKRCAQEESKCRHLEKEIHAMKKSIYNQICSTTPAASNHKQRSQRFETPAPNIPQSSMGYRGSTNVNIQLTNTPLCTTAGSSFIHTKSDGSVMRVSPILRTPGSQYTGSSKSSSKRVSWGPSS